MNGANFRELMVETIRSIVIFLVVFTVFELFSNEPTDWKGLIIKCIIIGIIYTFILRLFKGNRRSADSEQT